MKNLLKEVMIKDVTVKAVKQFEAIYITKVIVALPHYGIVALTKDL